MQLAHTGESIGGYRLLHLIGEGGMGVVYAAQHLLLGRRAAIKFLRAEVSSNPNVVERFFNEARAASAIRHPGIIEVYDFGYHNGLAYLVMEHLDGESLLARLKAARRLPFSQAIPIAIQIASALDAAHAASVVHRDLKPDNVFLVRTTGTDLTRTSDALGDERVCLLDFGVAKLLRGDGSWSASVTATDVVVGTPTFMSPEQCRGGGQVDGRSDLYSLGCILYGMLCGRPPFIGEGGGDVLAQHILLPPIPPSHFALDTPAPVEAVIMKLLEKDPARRHQSAPEAVTALREAYFASGGPPNTLQLMLAMPGGAATPLPRKPANRSPTGPVPAGTAPAVEEIEQNPTPLAPQLEPSVAETGPAPPRRWRRRWLIAGAIALVPAIAIFASSLGEDDRAPAAVPPAPPAAEAPRAVELVIESVPSGATVHRSPDGQRMGRTPYRIRRPAQEGYAAFEIRHDGYEPETISLRADVTVETQVVLRRLEPPPVADAPAAPVRRTSGPKSTSKGAQRGRNSGTKPSRKIDDSIVDPFAN